MEENIVQVPPSKKSGKLKNFFLAFFSALFLAFIFIMICFPFLINGNEAFFEEGAVVGQINLARIVIGFGILSVIVTILSFVRHTKNKFTILILWAFWILGVALSLVILINTHGVKLSAEIFTNNSPRFGISTLILFLPYFVWFFGIYYCRKVAMKLGMNGSIAVLAGIFLPVVSLIFYASRSFIKKEKKEKIKILKITASAIIAISLLATGVVYYAIGTPEYSLYKLKKSIIQNNETDFEKYFDLESVAENFGESPMQTKERIDGLGASVLEIREENPDKSKDAIVYIPTGLSGKNLKSASVEYGDGEPQVSLEFDSEGANLFADITKRNVGKEVAIFLDGNLIGTPSVQIEITDGRAFVSGHGYDRTKFIVNAINKEKAGIVDGFKIRKEVVDGNFSKITIGKPTNQSGLDISMKKEEGRYWKVNKIDVVFIANEEKLPAQEGKKTVTFDWKYKGKKYSLNENLYDSYYKFYNTLPAESVFNGESLVSGLENKNALFVNEVGGDKTINELAQSIKALGEERNLSENQIVELVSTFVQTIPYDYEELKNIDSGSHKVDYPYEVLYKNTGICSDKSYLAYSLLKNLGYGVSFFLFPEDRHIAVGVQCPIKYSNYDSGYCFLETTSLGNKIGSTPNIIEGSRIASSNIELGDFGVDSSENQSQPLGKIEVLNKLHGKEYTGVIETFNTQKEIDNLLATLNRMNREINASRPGLDAQLADIEKMVDRLDKLAKSNNSSAYDDYDDLYSKYKKANSKFEKERKVFNDKIEEYNKINNRYNSLVRSFYQ